MSLSHGNVDFILHLIDCPIIRSEFWDEILEILRRFGMKQPDNISAFIALGRIDSTTVVDKHLAGIMFLAWRCLLYAEITRARIDQKTLDPASGTTTNG